MGFIYILVVIVLAYAAYEGVFWLTHRKSLQSDDIELLAEKRRVIFLNKYFQFSPHEMIVNKSFKSKMKPTGKIYRISESLLNIPSIAAGLLKYKKHEWIIIGFENEKKVEFMWVNKGFDKTSVSLSWNYQDIADFCEENNISTALMFHNHPNSNPNLYNCTQPSQVDINSAESFASVLSTIGVNLIEFVCERGMYYRYFYSYSNSFKPKNYFISDIKKSNGIDKKTNYKLHREIRSIKNIKLT